LSLLFAKKDNRLRIDKRSRMLEREVENRK
jgi:hypothetical protein